MSSKTHRFLGIFYSLCCWLIQQHYCIDVGFHVSLQEHSQEGVTVVDTLRILDFGFFHQNPLRTPKDDPLDH